MTEVFQPVWGRCVAEVKDYRDALQECGKLVSSVKDV